MFVNSIVKYRNIDARWTPCGGFGRQRTDRVPSEEFSDILKELETWYARDKGRQLLQTLEEALAAKLDTAFGYHLAQVGVTGDHPLFEQSRIRHRVVVSDQPGGSVGLVAEADQLPLASDSVDVLIAHHCLEFSAHPHRVLRELHRVLTPHGHLFIIAFNPLSLQGVKLIARARTGTGGWHRWRGLSTGRVIDWLNVLGLEEEGTKQYYALPLLGGRRSRGLISRCNHWCTRHNLPLGGVYLIHAIKQVHGNIRPQRHRRGRLIGLAVPKPAVSASSRQGASTRRNERVK